MSKLIRPPATTRPEIVGNFGMVTSSHWLGSAVGMSILERGGNAADAAVATGFVLQVVEPHLNGPGGEVPILVSDATDEVKVINGQGVTASASTLEKLDELGLDVMPGTGLLPAVVPGAFGAWMTLLKEYGTMTPREVLEPAIHYCKQGHPILQRVSNTIATVEELFTKHWPTSAKVWLPEGQVPAKESTFKNPDLAHTYERIIAEAENVGTDREAQIDAALGAWYQGFVAEAIADFCATHDILDTSGKAHKGLLTAADIAAWAPKIEEALSYEYRGTTVYKTDTWAQGLVFLQQLAILDKTDLANMRPGSAEWIHTITEASKLAFADREAWYGDPRFTDVPVQDLLSDEYNEQRANLITDRAATEIMPGSPGGRTPRLPNFPPPGKLAESSLNAVGEPTVSRDGETRGDTCHIDVVDSSGMMISATPSGGWFQSSPTIEGLGFSLSTRGQMFWLEEGLANSLRPSAAPRSTLTPSMVHRDGKPWLAFGTPGGDAQDQWTLQFFLNLMHSDMNLQEAIEFPAFHSTHIPNSFYPHEHFPAQIMIEDRVDQEALEQLRAMGHDLKVGPSWSEGYTVSVAKEDGWFKAAASPRGKAYAAGR